MFSATQIKAKILTPEGHRTFTTGEPLTGYVEIASPGKVHVRKLLLTIQDTQLLLTVPDGRLIAGKQRLPFTSEARVNFPGGGEELVVRDYAEVQLYPNFSRFKVRTDQARTSFRASDGSFHRIRSDFKVTLAEGNYVVESTRLPWDRHKVLPVIFLAVALTTLVWLLDTSWPPLILVALLLLVLEQRFTHNAYFAGLTNRVYTDADGKSYLEVTADRGIARFLKGELTLRAESINTNVLRGGRNELYAASIPLLDYHRRAGARYRVPLPFPDRVLPGTFHHHRYPSVVWTLEYRLVRGLLTSFDFSVPLRVGLLRG